MYGSGDSARDYTYVDDIVDALLRTGYFTKAVGREMNIASAQETGILAMAEIGATATRGVSRVGAVSGVGSILGPPLAARQQS